MATESTPQPALNVAGLSWHVRDKVILDDVSFDVSEGEFVGVIGPNGAGKSSLLRCLFRKTLPTEGNIELLGQPLENYSRRALAKKMAVVQQESPVQFDLSVKDVIALGLIPHKPLLGFDTKEDAGKVLKAANQVDVAHLLERDFNDLSGGEKQRTMIARAIVQAPSVLLMDEPTNHLDVHHQIEVLELAKAMGITVVVSIHDLNLAAAFCDRLILMDRGAVVATGPSAEVLTEQHLAKVFSVKAAVDQHPFSVAPRITYDFGGGDR